MKIPGARKGLSQSTDLLLILTATLAVGGIMYAVATGLVTGLGNVSSIQVLSVGLHVGSSSSAFTISLKNSGNTVVSGSASITIAGVTITPANIVGSVTWTCAVPPTCTAASVTLSPGGLLSLSFTTASGFTAGNTYAISGVVGSATFSTSVVATSS